MRHRRVIAFAESASELLANPLSALCWIAFSFAPVAALACIAVGAFGRQPDSGRRGGR
ncbi:MAG: hypothetical protein AAF411_01220 [Myxococcota bacterium]